MGLAAAGRVAAFVVGLVVLPAGGAVALVPGGIVESGEVGTRAPRLFPFCVAIGSSSVVAPAAARLTVLLGGTASVAGDNTIDREGMIPFGPGRPPMGVPPIRHRRRSCP